MRVNQSRQDHPSLEIDDARLGLNQRLQFIRRARGNDTSVANGHRLHNSEFRVSRNDLPSADNDVGRLIRSNDKRSDK